MKRKCFWMFVFLNGFSTHFLNIISKTPTLCNAKILIQEDLKYAYRILLGATEAILFT
jgi:hypothetical protein